MTGKSCAVAAVAAGMALCMTGFAQQANLTEQDRNFLQELSQSNRVEVQLGRMAEQKATNPKVKDFARQMVNDHSKLQNQLEDFTAKRNFTLSTSTTPQQQNMVDQLQGMSGNEFDKQYMTRMLQDHKQDVAKVQQHMTTSQDPAVQDLARKTLPFLENHVRIAENIAGEMGIPADPGLNEPVHPQ